jgi:hypothetical protein
MGSLGFCFVGFADIFRGFDPSVHLQEWVAVWRRTYGVAESFIGCQQLKQVNLFKTPSRHLKFFGKRLHERHNPEGYQEFMEEAMRRVDQSVSLLLFGCT